MKTKVREIFHKGASSVVEWSDASGSINRVILPSTELLVEPGGTFVENIEEGQPYGAAWEDLIHTQMGPKAIAALLRKNGIWTLEDYADNSRGVTSVFNEACTANLQAFKEAVLRQGKEE